MQEARKDGHFIPEFMFCLTLVQILIDNSQIFDLTWVATLLLKTSSLNELVVFLTHALCGNDQEYYDSGNHWSHVLVFIPYFVGLPLFFWGKLFCVYGDHSSHLTVTIWPHNGVVKG